MSEHSIEQAKAQLDSILEFHRGFLALQDGAESIEIEGDAIEDTDRLEEHAQEFILSVEGRSGWHTIDQVLERQEFRICLCTGGPAVQIIGNIGLHGEPADPKLQHQDWFEPWADYGLPIGTGGDEFQTRIKQANEALEWFCGLFYFGED